MQQTPNTPLIIRVQANDGMFLGPDSYGGAIITISNVATKEVLVSGFTDRGNSGERSENTYVPGASSNPIVTPYPQGTSVYWVVATEQTVQFATDIFLAEPCLLKIEARIPLPKTQGDQYVSATQWVVPEVGLQTKQGFVLEVPGLWVQPEIIPAPDQLRIRAKVTMMCGCEVNESTDKKKSPWIPEDFVVIAAIYKRDTETKQAITTTPLTFTVNSQFSQQLPSPPEGTYTATITAYQKSTGNTGVAYYDFAVAARQETK